jgi:hypothetical protein
MDSTENTKVKVLKPGDQVSIARLRNGINMVYLTVANWQSNCNTLNRKPQPIYEKIVLIAVLAFIMASVPSWPFTKTGIVSLLTHHAGNISGNRKVVSVLNSQTKSAEFPC